VPLAKEQNELVSLTQTANVYNNALVCLGI